MHRQLRCSACVRERERDAKDRRKLDEEMESAWQGEGRELTGEGEGKENGKG